MSCPIKNITKVFGRKVSMYAMIKHAVDHWYYVAPLLRKPENVDDFNTLVEALDDLLDTVGDDESHPLIGLIHQLGDLVSAYENEHLPMPQGDGRAALAFFNGAAWFGPVRFTRSSNPVCYLRNFKR